MCIYASFIIILNYYYVLRINFIVLQTILYYSIIIVLCINYYT